MAGECERSYRRIWFQSQSKTRVFRHITVTDTVHFRKGT